MIIDDYDIITSEEYVRAAANGIPAERLRIRIRNNGWDRDRAITTPVAKRHDRRKWVELAAQNGIRQNTFFNRLSRGMSEEEAATQPLRTQQEALARMQEARHRQCAYPQELLELAERNGVSRQTFYHRVRKSGWDLERAATTPPLSYRERERERAQLKRKRRAKAR